MELLVLLRDSSRVMRTCVVAKGDGFEPSKILNEMKTRQLYKEMSSFIALGMLDAAADLR